MRLLVDTQIAIWWFLEDRRLSGSIRDLLETSDEPVLVSHVSLWEVAIKTGTGKLHLAPRTFAAEVERLGFAWLPILPMHLFEVAALPRFPDHRDPFDRLLVAQARVESLTLVTADRRLERYGESVRVV